MVRSAAQKSTAHKRGASSDHVARGKRAKQLDDSLDELLGEEGSEFEDADSTTPSADEDEDSDDFDDRKTPRSRRISKAYGKKSETGSGSRKKSAPNKLSAKDLSKPGVKTGLGPGTQVVIKRPKARDPGDTPYSDEIIHPNTMLFLEDLAANNNRQWLKMHDPDYRAAQKDWATFVESITHKITEIDETIPELPVKDIIFRIYRDVRFSSDPTPYKTAFSAAWSRTGRKGPYAAYYVQIKPNGGSLVAGGLWMPDAQALAKLRRAIDRKSHLMKRSLLGEGLRKEFLGGVSLDEGKAAKAFAAQNKENALKTKPKGFDPEHRDIELLRLRNFTLHRKVQDGDVIGPQALSTITDLISCLVPFITYLNGVVMPDEESESSEEEQTEEEEEQ